MKKQSREVAEVGSNGPFRGGKYELFEGGIRVPALVRWPGLTRAGTVARTPSWFCDWVPTLAGRATQDGIDLRAALAGKPDRASRTLRWTFEDSLVKTPLSVAERTGNWKRLRVGSEQYRFDLENDPGETKNLWNPLLAPL